MSVGLVMGGSWWGENKHQNRVGRETGETGGATALMKDAMYIYSNASALIKHKVG